MVRPGRGEAFNHATYPKYFNNQDSPATFALTSYRASLSLHPGLLSGPWAERPGKRKVSKLLGFFYIVW